MSLAARIKQQKLEQQAAAKEAAANLPAPKRHSPIQIAPSFPANEDNLARPSNSPARRQRQIKLAELAVRHGMAGHFAPDRSLNDADYSEYELQLAALGNDLAQLKSIHSTEGKVAAKRDLIDKYTHHVDATLSAAAETGKAVQDELLVNMMIWRFDIGDYDRALDIAEHVLRYGLRLPERFTRVPATLIAEEVAEAALNAQKMNKPFALPILQRAAQLTGDFDMHDQVRAKIEKALGQELIRSAEALDEDDSNAPAGAAYAARATALTHLSRAIELNDRAGVKRDIDRLTAWLAGQEARKSAAADTENPTE